MNLYHTGATAHNVAQTNPLKSLGGKISSTPVSNGRLDGLFSAISQADLLDGSKQVRCVALKNTSGGSVSVNLYYELNNPDPITSYRMAVVQVAIDNCNEPYLESIQTDNQRPVQATFLNNLESSNAISFTLDDQAYIGIWIERRVSKIKGEARLDCDALYAKYQTTATAQVFTAQVVTNNDQSYFTFDTSQGKYYVYITSTDTDVSVEGREPIKVAVLGGDTASQVATKIKAKLDVLLEDEISVAVDTDTLTITQLQNGDLNLPTASDANIVVAQTTQGASAENSQIEDVSFVMSY